ncbi:sensor histidine kinase [Noviherbaspirillum sedimenti]|uniref:histidine kinase n=1 Tax=Noviherbaspirillum sedimenti TaxID=2320865 RepID=A0A3A3FY30_9BURK|nr:HAMP domain-containing sensor histidine kinase [Noviherbaspirillum sedimenti]RJG01128.1 sensor histidine kinase [Noviherbaspirillum sedimenti]
MDHPPQEPVLSLFLASSVHDMKNSVGMLSASLEKLLGELDPQAFAAYQEMAHMLFEVRRVNGNLTQLLTLYKLGERLYPFDPQACAIDQCALELESMNRTLLDSRGITLYVDNPPGLIWHFDEDLIGGVLNHAINNAIRYTHDKIRLAFTLHDGRLEVRVEDNGPGYPEALLAAPAACQGVNFGSGSTGLGLYFAREVASLHRHRERQGTLRLENGGALGGGCFILELP